MGVARTEYGRHSRLINKTGRGNYAAKGRSNLYSMVYRSSQRNGNQGTKLQVMRLQATVVQLSVSGMQNTNVFYAALPLIL